MANKEYAQLLMNVIDNFESVINCDEDKTGISEVVCGHTESIFFCKILDLPLSSSISHAKQLLNSILV